jgi:hypothetical protein
MAQIELKTLIDITNTDVRRPNQGTQIEADQYRNWVTLKQCIELRSLVEFDHYPTVETIDVKDLEFGTAYNGKQAVWTFRFYPDQAGAFATEDSELGLLLNAIDKVPVIKNLTETINTDRSIFDLNDTKFKNTIVRLI